MVPQDYAATELESPFHGPILNSDDESDHDGPSASQQAFGVNGFGDDGDEFGGEDEDPIPINPNLHPFDPCLASEAAPAEGPAGEGMVSNETAVAEHLEDGQGWWSRSPSVTSPPNPIHAKSEVDPSTFETLPYNVPEIETATTSPSKDLTAIEARIALLQNLTLNLIA